MIKRDIVIGVILLAIAAAVPFLWPERYVLLELTLFFIYATVVTQWNLVFGVRRRLFAGADGDLRHGRLRDRHARPLSALVPVGSDAARRRRRGHFQRHHRARVLAPRRRLCGAADVRHRRGHVFADHYRHRMFLHGRRDLPQFHRRHARPGEFRQLRISAVLGYKYAAFGNYFLALALLALATAFSVFVIRSPWAWRSRPCATTRPTPSRAASAGSIPVARLCRLCVFTGLAGAVYAGYFSVMGADTLNLSLLLCCCL